MNEPTTVIQGERYRLMLLTPQLIRLESLRTVPRRRCKTGHFRQLNTGCGARNAALSFRLRS